LEREQKERRKVEEKERDGSSSSKVESISKC